MREYSGAYIALKIDEIGSALVSAKSTVLNESRVLSVVKEASSELVKIDQSLDVASENSTPMGSGHVSITGMAFRFALLRMPLEAWLVKPLATSGLTPSLKGSEPAYGPLGLLCPGLEGFDIK